MASVVIQLGGVIVFVKVALPLGLLGLLVSSYYHFEAGDLENILEEASTEKTPKDDPLPLDGPQGGSS